MDFHQCQHLKAHRKSSSRFLHFHRQFSLNIPIAVAINSKLTTISIVNSNYSLIISIKVVFSTKPSLSGWPPRATKASKYSSPSLVWSSASSSFLSWVSTAQSAWKSRRADLRDVRNSCNQFIIDGYTLYPHAERTIGSSYSSSIVPCFFCEQ